MNAPAASSSAVPPIAVVGAGGPTGRAVIEGLAEAGLPGRALVHRAEQEAEMLAAGAAEVGTIELDDPATFAAALDGAGAIHFIPPVFKARENEQATALLAAAGEAGVDRFVMHSVLHAFTPGLRHHERKARTEAIVRASGLRWTILQPAMYAQTMRFYWEKSPDGKVVVPYDLDTPFTPVDLRDLAAATAIVHGQDAHDLATYELAGTEVLSTREMMAQLAAALGVEFELRRGDLADLTLPPTWTDDSHQDMAAMCRHYDEVGLAGNGNALAMLLGRPPTTFAAAIAAGQDRRWA